MGLRPKEEKSLWKPIRRTKNNSLISQLDWLCSRLGKGEGKKKKTWEQKFHGNKHLLFMASIPGKLSVWLLESRSEVKVIVSVYSSQIEGTESPHLFYISTRSKYLYFCLTRHSQIVSGVLNKDDNISLRLLDDRLASIAQIAKKGGQNEFSGCW